MAPTKASKRPKPEFADQVRAALAAREMKLAALAQEIGLSIPMVSRFLRGETFLSEDSMNRVAAFLNITVPRKEK